MAKDSAAVDKSVDISVGRRLKAQRTLAGVSQGKLGEMVGLSFQQIQKYEQGSNRISAGRLYQFASVLGVSVDYFFEDLVDVDAIEGVTPVVGDDPAQRREVLSLIGAYYKIEDPLVRKRVFELAKTMAEA